MKKSMTKLSGAAFVFAATMALMAVPALAQTVNVTFVTPYGNYVSVVEQGRSATYNGPVDVNVKGFAFCGLINAFSETLGKEVDVVTTASLDQDFLDYISREEVLLYA